MRTMPAKQAVLAAEILIQNQILSHQSHGFDGVVGKLARAGNRMPIAPQQIAHRGAAPYTRQHLVPGLVHASNLPTATACRILAGARCFSWNYPKLEVQAQARLARVMRCAQSGALPTCCSANLTGL